MAAVGIMSFSEMSFVLANFNGFFGRTLKNALFHIDFDVSFLFDRTMTNVIGPDYFE